MYWIEVILTLGGLSQGKAVTLSKNDLIVAAECMLTMGGEVVTEAIYQEYLKSLRWQYSNLRITEDLYNRTVTFRR